MLQYLTSCLLLYRHNKIKWTFSSLHTTNLQWLKEKFISTIWQIFSLLWDQCSQHALLRNCTYTGMNTQQFFCIRCDKKELFAPTLNVIPISNLHGSATPVILFLELNNQSWHMQINKTARIERTPKKWYGCWSRAQTFQVFRKSSAAKSIIYILTTHQHVVPQQSTQNTTRWGLKNL